MNLCYLYFTKKGSPQIPGVGFITNDALQPAAGAWGFWLVFVLRFRLWSSFTVMHRPEPLRAWASCLLGSMEGLQDCRVSVGLVMSREMQVILENRKLRARSNSTRITCFLPEDGTGKRAGEWGGAGEEGKGVLFLCLYFYLLFK